MGRNEKTSTRIAKIAGGILAVVPISKHERALLFDRKGTPHWFAWCDIRDLAASALTQTADHAYHIRRRFNPEMPLGPTEKPKRKRRAKSR